MFWNKKNELNFDLVVTPINVNIKTKRNDLRDLIIKDAPLLEDKIFELSTGELGVQIPQFSYGTGIIHIRILYAIEKMNTSEFDYFKKNIFYRKKDSYENINGISICIRDEFDPIAWKKFLLWNLSTISETPSLTQYDWTFDTDELNFKGVFSGVKCSFRMVSNPNYGNYDVNRKDTLILEKEYSDIEVETIELTDGKEIISEDGKIFKARKVNIDNEIIELIKLNIVLADFSIKNKFKLSFDNDG